MRALIKWVSSFIQPTINRQTRVIDVRVLSEHQHTRIGFKHCSDYRRCELTMKSVLFHCQQPGWFGAPRTFWQQCFDIDAVFLHHTGKKVAFQWISTLAEEQAAMDDCIDMFFYRRQLHHYANRLAALTADQNRR